MRLRTDRPRWKPLAGLVLALVLALCGCSLKYVADYDSTTLEQTLAAGKKVDLFYGNLLETLPSQRPYAKYSTSYVDIEVDLRALVSRNQARALNGESIRIAQIILEKWDKYKDNHKAKGGYPDGIARLDRDRFLRLFRAAADAEEAKKITTGGDPQ